METKKLFKPLLFLSMVVCMTSCTIGKKEVTVATVADSFESTYAYYVTGSVRDLDGYVDLEGASVAMSAVSSSASVSTVTDESGDYLLSVDETGEYLLTFSKSDYSDVTLSLTIASSTSNRSYTAVNQVSMTKVAVPQTLSLTDISANNASAYTFEDQLTETSTSITFPSDIIAALVADGSVDEVVITVASYEPEVATVVSSNVSSGTETVSAAISAVSISSNVAQVSDGSGDYYEFTVSAANSLSDGDYHFSNVTVEESDVLATKASDASEAVFNSTTNTYDYSTTTLSSDYQFTINPTVTTSSISTSSTDGNTVNGESEFVYYNEGKTSAVTDYILTINIQLGWDYVDDVESVIKSSFSGISDAEASSIASSISTIISSSEGKEGITVYESTESINISGDTNYYYKVNAKSCVKSYVFNLSSTDGVSKSVTIKLKNYYGSQTVRVVEEGSTHSGGSIS